MGAIRKALADTIKAAGRTPEETARLARRQRLDEVKAALTPAAPPPAPEPAPPSLLSTAAMLRAEIGQQPTAVPALNSQELLDSTGRLMSGNGAAQDDAVSVLKRQLDGRR
jgi:hypothetical protein